MKYKILKIERRNLFIRIFSICQWRTTVEFDDKSIKRYNCWAGIERYGTPITKDNLLHSLNKNVGKGVKSNDLQELIGSNGEIDI